MELIACKCRRVFKVTECQCVAVCWHEIIIYVTLYLATTLNIHSVDNTADEVIMTTTKMHKISKMSIVYTMMMSADC